MKTDEMFNIFDSLISGAAEGLAWCVVTICICDGSPRLEFERVYFQHEF